MAEVGPGHDRSVGGLTAWNGYTVIDMDMRKNFSAIVGHPAMAA